MSDPIGLATAELPHLLSILGKGFLLGLSLAVPLGPIGLEIIRRGLADRPNAGWALGMGACTVDGIYALLAGGGLAWLMQKTSLVILCQAAGAVLLTLMALGAWRSGRQQWHASQFGAAAVNAEVGTNGQIHTPLWRHYATGIAMTATAPMNVVFWLTVPARFFGGMAPPLSLVLLTSVAVLTGTCCWVTFLRVLIGLGRPWVRPRLLAVLSLAGGAALMGFAVWSAWGAARAFGG